MGVYLSRKMLIFSATYYVSIFTSKKVCKGDAKFEIFIPPSVFKHFSFDPSWKIQKKSPKRAEICEVSENPKSSILLKISAAYLKNRRMPSFLGGKYFQLGIPFLKKIQVTKSNPKKTRR